jgi:nicotinamidase-related amidase
MRHASLLDRRRVALAIIDMQEAFRPSIEDFGEIAARLALLLQAARLLELPVIVTEQYPKGLGRTVGEIAAHLPADVSPLEKISFSACGVQEFDTRLRERHAEQVIVGGIEAHVCVHQTVHDLLGRGYQVHVLSDAISSRLPRNRAVALDKMARSGALISSVEMAIFEMCDPSFPNFKAIQALVKELR